MKVKGLGNWGAVCGLLLAGLLLAGCRTSSTENSSFTNLSPGSPAGASGVAASTGAAGVAAGGGGTGSATAAVQDPASQLLRPGDNLVVVFSDLPKPPDPFQERINEKGQVTLLHNQQFDAAGKTREQLQQEIHDRYVPAFYKYMTVTIKPLDQFYFVGGEVRIPNRYQYVGTMTVRKAIQSAGDFTDFANKKNVIVTRANGRTQRVNCVKALKDPRYDLEIFPGDSINVNRRSF